MRWKFHICDTLATAAEAALLSGTAGLVDFHVSTATMENTACTSKSQ
jgi:hypothetical protein